MGFPLPPSHKDTVCSKWVSWCVFPLFNLHLSNKRLWETWIYVSNLISILHILGIVGKYFTNRRLSRNLSNNLSNKMSMSHEHGNRIKKWLIFLYKNCLASKKKLLLLMMKLFCTLNNYLSKDSGYFFALWPWIFKAKKAKQCL